MGEARAVPLRGLLTATGRVGRRVSLTAGLGYGAAFPFGVLRENPLLHQPIAHAGVGFRLGAEATATLGYWYDFRVQSDVLRLLRLQTAYLDIGAFVAQRM